MKKTKTSLDFDPPQQTYQGKTSGFFLDYQKLESSIAKKQVQLGYPRLHR